MPDRRQVLLSLAGAALAVARPAFAEEAPPVSEAAKLNRFFEAVAARSLRTSPETATSLGLDKDDLAWTKALLDDHSPAAVAEDIAAVSAQLKELRAIDRSKLSGMDAVNYDTVAFTLAVEDEGNRAFSYGESDSGAPYVLSQLGGAWSDVPDFLDTQHSIADKADADTYLARLEGFARVIEQQSDKARQDFAAGVIPPDFILDMAVAEIGKLAATGPADSVLVSSVVERCAKEGIKGDYAGEATRILENSIRPALNRQIDLLKQARPKTVHDAGCWRLPDGEKYYAVSLKSYTTATPSPAELHRTGLDLVASLTGEIDALMRQQGLSKGSVAERFQALTKDPKFLYDNTDAGKDKLIADLNGKVREIEARLPAAFGTLPKARLEIRRVPKASEASASGGYYNDGSLDGKRPGMYWINLRDTAEVPLWSLPTLTAHEGVPGHHLQLSLANEAGELPLIRKQIWFAGYGEGWALYAEELVAEMGLYDEDPIGRIGMLHDALIRAARLVIDSGLHDKRWSREQAIRYYVDTIGDSESTATTEVERYCVWPGQACSYMVGKLAWMRLREKAKAALGPRFDLRKFHDAALLSGAMPLTVLEDVVDAYIAKTKALL